jgi:hypothetical protein
MQLRTTVKQPILPQAACKAAADEAACAGYKGMHVPMNL